MMFTTDLALKVEPIYAVDRESASTRTRTSWQRNVCQGVVQAAHRDMGPVSR